MGTDSKLTQSGKNARNEYFRNWRREHPEKTKEYSDRYWSKRGKEQEQKSKAKGESEKK